ncbi:MAG: ATP-binding protein [Syntrophobacteraceae bacterium]
MVGQSAETGRLEAEVARLRARVSELEASREDRRTIEKTLEDQLRFLQTLIDTIPNPIFYKDKKGSYLGCNKAFERRIGLGRKEILGKSAFDLFPDAIAHRYEQHDMELFARPGEKAYEASITDADGIRRDVIITKGIFTDSEGRVAGLVGVTLDITERKRAEEILKKAHDELEKRVGARTAALARANAELKMQITERNRMTEELRSGAEKLKIFAYSVAHDLKSPSIGIYGLARLLQNRYGKLLGEKGGACCDQIMKASEHVASLVDAINTFIATKETPLKIERIEMDEVFHLLRDEFSARLRVRRISLIEPEAGTVIRADKLSVLRVFRNLIDNAVKYGGERLANIVIGYEQTEKFHHFAVSDDGIGIKGKDSGRIFNLFERREGAKGVEGTGLGLAIVKEIIELHGGEVWVEAAKEGGTVFHVLISNGL